MHLNTRPLLLSLGNRLKMRTGTHKSLASGDLKWYFPKLLVSSFYCLTVQVQNPSLRQTPLSLPRFPCIRWELLSSSRWYNVKANLSYVIILQKKWFCYVERSDTICLKSLRVGAPNQNVYFQISFTPKSHYHILHCIMFYLHVVTFM